MKKNNKLIIVLFLIIFFLCGYLTGMRYPPSVFINNTGTSIFKNLTNNSNLLNQTFDILQNNFYKKISSDGLIKGMVNSLNDPYTAFFDPAETKDLQAEIEGIYAGIGVVIKMNEKEQILEIVSVFKNTPAEQAGLKSGDLIEKADSTALKGLSLEEASLKVKGEIGTSVVLTIKRENEELTFTIKRENIKIPIIEKDYRDDGKIGYLKFNMFTDNSSAEFNSVLNEFKQKNVKGVILDLRDNSGGLLAECEKIASNFIPSGILLWTRNRDGLTEPLKIKGQEFNLPLVVLINNGTASAAEILTGVIKDYNVGTIIGENTFGKGVIQQIFNLPGSYTLKVTVEEYLTPNKIEINGKGITPDITVQNNPDKPQEDLQLQKAIEILSKEI
ncbi:MAG: peptidase S41 [Caldiserica bacterium CG17_big_fil_post_rev_8_21_14_2_50_35_7]|nr:MAG: peptidase S41 [Caldiserica bacterium CG17_big_fil_post_rev_8_21_14_2_50_35_7]